MQKLICHFFIFIGIPLWLLGCAVISQDAKTSVEAKLSFAEKEEIFQPLVSHYLMAVYAEREKNYIFAAKSYVSALAEDTQNLVLKERAFALSLAIGDMSTAVRLAKTFVQAHNPNPMVWLVLVVDSLKQQNFKQAKIYLKRARAVSPDVLHFELISQYLEYFSGEKAQNISKNLKKHITHRALKAQKYYYIARIWLHEKNIEKALEFFKKSYILEPSALLTTRELGRLLEYKGEKERAKNVYQAFLAINSDVLLLQNALKRLKFNEKLPLETLSIGREFGDIFFSFSMLMWSQNLDITAGQLLNMALWLAPEEGVFTYYAGLMEETAGHLDKAIIHHKNIQPKADTYLAAQQRLAEIFYQLGKKDEGFALLEAQLVTYPDLVLLRQTLAEMYYDAGKFKKAIEHYDIIFQKIKKPSKQHVRLYFARGASYERLKDFTRATKDLKKALKLDPDNATILNYLGYMWVERGEHIDKAFAMLSKALILQPNDGAIMDSLGWAYYQKGEIHKALLYVERAAEALPTDPVIFEHLGDIYYKMKNVSKARLYWQQSLDLAPEEKKDIQRLHQKLEQIQSVHK